MTKNTRNSTEIYVTVNTMLDSGTFRAFLKTVSASKKQRKLVIFHKPDAASGFDSLKLLLEASSGNLSVEFMEFTSETSLAFLTGFLAGKHADQARMYSILPEEYGIYDGSAKPERIINWTPVNEHCSQTQKGKTAAKTSTGRTQAAAPAPENAGDSSCMENIVFMSGDAGEFFTRQLADTDIPDSDIMRLAVCMKQAVENHTELEKTLEAEFGSRAGDIYRQIEKKLSLLYGCLFIRRRQEKG